MKNKAKKALTQLEELMDAGIAITFDDATGLNKVRKAIVYPKGKWDLKDHSHYEAEDLKELINIIHKKYIHND